MYMLNSTINNDVKVVTVYIWDASICITEWHLLHSAPVSEVVCSSCTFIRCKWMTCQTLFHHYRIGSDMVYVSKRTFFFFLTGVKPTPPPHTHTHTHTSVSVSRRIPRVMHHAGSDEAVNCVSQSVFWWMRWLPSISSCMLARSRHNSQIIILNLLAKFLQLMQEQWFQENLCSRWTLQMYVKTTVKKSKNPIIINQ